MNELSVPIVVVDVPRRVGSIDERIAAIAEEHLGRQVSEHTRLTLLSAVRDEVAVHYAKGGMFADAAGDPILTFEEVGHAGSFPMRPFAPYDVGNIGKRPDIIIREPHTAGVSRVAFFRNDF